MKDHRLKALGNCGKIKADGEGFPISGFFPGGQGANRSRLLTGKAGVSACDGRR